MDFTYQKEKGKHSAEKLQFTMLKGRRLKLGNTHPHTIESLKNLIALYEAWNKLEKANEWRAELARIEGFAQEITSKPLPQNNHQFFIPSNIDLIVFR